jgi:hypothetical protein
VSKVALGAGSIDADSLTSPWSASLWIQLLDDTRIKAEREISDKRITIHLDQLPFLPARPVSGSGPEGMVLGILGHVVADAAGDLVQRPLELLTGSSAAGGKLVFDPTIPLEGTLFLQLIVVHRFDGKEPVAPVGAWFDLAKYQRWFGQGDNDVPERIVAFGPRVDLR